MSAIPLSSLRFDDIFRLGSVGLSSRRLRAALSALGIAIGIAAMVVVVGISSSSRADLLAQLDKLGTNLLIVTPGQTLFGDSAKLSTDAAGMVARIAPVQQVTETGTVSGTVRRTDKIPSEQSGGIGIVAAQTDLVATVAAKMHSGVFLNAATERYPAVVLGSKAAQRLGITTVDPKNPPVVWLGGHWFTVVGVLDPVTLVPSIDTSALVGFPVAESLLDFDGHPTAIYERSTPQSVNAVRSVLSATVDPAHPENVNVSRPSDALKARNAANSAFTSLLLALGGVSLLVGGVGIANVMVISVLERRSEIGLRRALGATGRHILAQFVTESLLLSLLGGVCGAMLGWMVSAGYALSQSWRIDVPVTAMAAGVGAAVLIGAVAGLYPAIRAAWLSPTEALRSS